MVTTRAALARENLTAVAAEPSSLLFKLPEEVRLLVYAYLVPEQQPRLRGGISQRSKDFREPGFAAVCQQIRHEFLPVYYARRAFLIAVSRANEFDNIKASMLRIAHVSPLGKMKKLSIHGTANRGQTTITFDLSALKIADARVAVSQDQLRRTVSEEHYHLGMSRLCQFETALALVRQGPLDHDLEGAAPDDVWRQSRLQALWAMLQVVEQYFFIRRTSRVSCSAARLSSAGNDSSGPCLCRVLVEPFPNVRPTTRP